MAVPHQETVKAGERSVVAFADNAVESAFGLLGCLVRKLDGKAVECVEMVAGDDGAGVKVPEVFDAAYLFENELLLVDLAVDETVSDHKRELRFRLLDDASAVIFDLVGHQHP